MAEYFNYRLTQDAVLYFSNLYTPSTFVPKKGGKPGEPRFNLKILLAADGPDVAAIWNMIVEANEGVVPTKHPLTTADDLIAVAVVLGKPATTIEKMQKSLAGKVQFAAHATAARPPMLGAFINGVATNLADPQMRAAAEEKFYTGALVRAEVSLKAYSEFGGGVTGYFNSVFSHGRGDRIGGSADATAFAGLVYKGAVSGATFGRPATPAETF